MKIKLIENLSKFLFNSNQVYMDPGVLRTHVKLDYSYHEIRMYVVHGVLQVYTWSESHHNGDRYDERNVGLTLTDEIADAILDDLTYRYYAKEIARLESAADIARQEAFRSMVIKPEVRWNET